MTPYLGKSHKINVTLPDLLIKRIDNTVSTQGDYQSRSGFLQSEIFPNREKSITVLAGNSDGHAKNLSLLQDSGFSYPFVKRQIAQLAARLSELMDSQRLQDALANAGLKEQGWRRLQQQRQHIDRQCRKAARW